MTLLLRSIEKSYNENSVQRWSQTMIYHLASPYFLTSCCILIRIAPSLLAAPSVTLSCHLKALLGVRSRTEMFTIIAELDDGPHNSRPTPFSADFIFIPGTGCQKKSWLELSGLLMKNDSQPYLVVLWRASPMLAREVQCLQSSSRGSQQRNSQVKARDQWVKSFLKHANEWTLFAIVAISHLCKHCFTPAAAGVTRGGSGSEFFCCSTSMHDHGENDATFDVNGFTKARIDPSLPSLCAHYFF